MASNLSRPETVVDLSVDRGDRSHGADSASVHVRRGAKAFVTADEQVLLVKERREDGSTFWTLPGGGVDGDESLEACVRREIAEELQCRSVVEEPLTTCVYQHTSWQDTVTVYTVFASELQTEPEPVRDEGIVDYAWSSPEDPPEATLPPFRRTLLDLADSDESACD